MPIATFAGLLLLALCLVLLLRNNRPEMALVFSICAAVFFFIYALADLTAVFLWFRELCAQSAFAPYMTVLVKALGIGLLTGFLAEICRDVGEGTLCRAAELCGKGAILLLALPLMKEFLDKLSSVSSV